MTPHSTFFKIVTLQGEGEEEKEDNMILVSLGLLLCAVGILKLHRLSPIVTKQDDYPAHPHATSSVKNKLPDFRVLTESQPDTIFAACETWLDCSVYDSQLVDLAHFKIFRKDRNKSGGGVLLAVPSHFKCTRRLDLEQHGLEAVFVDLHRKGGLLHLCVVYCPPGNKVEAYDYLHKSLTALLHLDKRYANICVVGDYNAHVNWSDPTTPVPADPQDDLLLNGMESLGLTQMCLEPSYTPNGKRDSFLDLIFVSNPTLIANCFAETSLAGCDHRAIVTETYMNFPKSGIHSKQLKRFAEIDLKHLNSLLHLAPWGMVFQEDNTENAYNLWLDFMHAIETECVPAVWRRNKSRAPWITKEILHLARQKRQLFARAKNNRCAATLSAAHAAQRGLKKMIRKSHQNYALSVAERAFKEPKVFWAYSGHHLYQINSSNFAQSRILQLTKSNSL
ncbi:uncharacterized protein LOC121836598 [Ixodes scapularis]|uniref:uncharacterized protein LOC121836598 n=1 Tax=Ixodes scapularis TaxID=6945 RepID=UPI001C38C9C6|nr:uncharacterized protein LOC121836598 [Ixodes scapularis]